MTSSESGRWVMAAVLAAGLGCGPGASDGLDEGGDESTAGDESTGDDDPAADGDPSGDGDPAGDGDGDPAGDGDGEPGPVCGDGVLDPGEDCDDGNDVDGDVCDNDCTWSVASLCAEPHPQLQVAGRELAPLADPDGLLLCDRLDAPAPSPDWAGPGWYRAGNGGSEFLLWGVAPPDYACGGMAGGYQTTTPAGPGDGIVDVEICFAFADDPCAWSVEAQQVDCGDQYLWNLPEVPDCALRYCVAAVEPP